MTGEHQPRDEQGDFAEEAVRLAENAPGLIGEFWYYLRQSRKWWMVPIILSLAVAGVLLVLGTTAAAPFIYTLF